MFWLFGKEIKDKDWFFIFFLAFFLHVNFLKTGQLTILNKTFIVLNFVFFILLSEMISLRSKYGQIPYCPHLSLFFNWKYSSLKILFENKESLKMCKCASVQMCKFVTLPLKISILFFQFFSGDFFFSKIRILNFYREFTAFFIRF